MKKIALLIILGLVWASGAISFAAQKDFGPMSEEGANQPIQVRICENAEWLLQHRIIPLIRQYYQKEEWDKKWYTIPTTISTEIEGQESIIGKVEIMRGSKKQCLLSLKILLNEKGRKIFPNYKRIYFHTYITRHHRKQDIDFGTLTLHKNFPECLIFDVWGRKLYQNGK